MPIAGVFIMRRLALFLMAFLFSGCVYSFELTPGVVQRFDMDFTDEQRAALTVVTSEVREVASREETGISLAFLKLGETDSWFRLYNNLTLYGVDVSQEQLIGTWPLTRWGGELTPEIEAIYQIPGEGSILLDPGLLDEEYSYAFHPDGFEQSLGCYMESPLRYGDMLSLPGNELVIFLGVPSACPAGHHASRLP